LIDAFAGKRSGALRRGSLSYDVNSRFTQERIDRRSGGDYTWNAGRWGYFAWGGETYYNYDYDYAYDAAGNRTRSRADRPRTPPAGLHVPDGAR
jgi:hypothetical protein